MDDDFTPLFNPLPSVMVVGVPDALEAACAAALEPIKVLRVAHGAAALPRMLANHPLIIIIGASIPEKEVQAIVQHAEAIGAPVLRERDLDMSLLDLQLKTAMRATTKARATRGM